METINIIILSVSGLLLLMVGTLRLSSPIKNYAKNSGITLPNDVDLLNEMRGIGALMFMGSIIILLGIIVPELTTSSFVVATMIFLGFALGRVVSSSADGKPNKKIIQGLISELVLGATNAYCLISISA